MTSSSPSTPSTPSTHTVGPRQVDPRGPRFSAGITAVLLIVAFGLSLVETPGASLAERAGRPAFVLLAIIAALFVWGAAAGVARHPYGLFFRAVIRPRLSPPTELENAAPPRFAQLVGLIVTAAGLLLHLAGVPYALSVASAAAFVAAFLNSVFGYCLGCELYLLLVRAGVIGRRQAAV